MQQQQLTARELVQLKHKELFYSKYLESHVNVDTFRGKLQLDLFMSDVSSFADYLTPADLTNNKFFYQIAYDPNLKVLSADKQEIRVGARFQADVPDMVKRRAGAKKSGEEERETKVFCGEESVEKLGELGVKRLLNKMIDSKLLAGETQAFKEFEISQSRDSIMVNI